MSAKNLAIGILFALVAAAPAAVQDDIPACTADELEIISTKINESLSDLSIVITEDLDDIAETMDDVTIVQRRHWTEIALGNIPECAEKYTRYYEFGRVIDNYSIAYGLIATSAVARLSGDEDQAERLSDQAAKHVREANRALENVFPESGE